MIPLLYNTSAGTFCQENSYETNEKIMLKCNRMMPRFCTKPLFQKQRHAPLESKEAHVVKFVYETYLYCRRLCPNCTGKVGYNCAAAPGGLAANCCRLSIPDLTYHWFKHVKSSTQPPKPLRTASGAMI